MIKIPRNLKIVFFTSIFFCSLLFTNARLGKAEEGTPDPICNQLGTETVSTDKEDYSPEEIVHIAGSGYSPNCSVIVKVTRPDGSVVSGDGSFTEGSDTINTDADGNFIYDYILDGIEGTYLVYVQGQNGTVLASTTFTDATLLTYDYAATTNCTANFTSTNQRSVFAREGTVCARTTSLVAATSHKFRVLDPFTPFGRTQKQLSSCFTGVTTANDSYLTLAADELSDQVGTDANTRWQYIIQAFPTAGCIGSPTNTVGPFGIGFRLSDGWSFDSLANRNLCTGSATCDTNDTSNFLPGQDIYLRVRGYFQNASNITTTLLDPANNTTVCNLTGLTSNSTGTIDVLFNVSSCFGANAPLGNWKLRIRDLSGPGCTTGIGECNDPLRRVEVDAFTLYKADTTSTTVVHDPDHTVITGNAVDVGTAVHDKILVAGRVDGFPFSGSADFNLYNGSDCGETGSLRSTENVSITDNGNGSDGTAESSDVTLPVGTYSYKALYSSDSDYNDSEAGCEPFYVIGNAVTNSSLCKFDINDVIDSSQFRLIYTPDQATSAWKLNASNPGQFYYNVFVVGTDGDEETVKITLPKPFVTKGANPIHVYDGVTVLENDQTCYTPANEIPSSANPETTALGDYSGGNTKVIDVTFTFNSTGVAYIAVHLDYGWKHYLSGCSPVPNKTISNAECTVPTPTETINNHSSYLFSFANAFSGNSTVENENVFKNDPGIGGLVTNTNGDPVPGVAVQIFNSKNQLVATVFTDADGWYMWAYKYTGKAQTFTVKLPAYNLSQSVTLKANGYVVASFIVP